MRRLFIVETDRTTEQADVLAILGGNDALPYQVFSCGSLEGASISLSPTDLVLVVATAKTSSPSAVLEWLADHPVIPLTARYSLHRGTMPAHLYPWNPSLGARKNQNSP